MEETNKVGVFLIAFITLLVGIVLLDVTADQIWLRADGLYTATEEVVTLSNVSAVNLANNWVTGITTVLGVYSATANATLTSDNYTAGNLNDDGYGTILLVAGVGGSSFEGNTSYITYNYQDDTYVRDAGSRVFIRLIVIFFAFAILATAIWAMYKMGIFELLK